MLGLALGFALLGAQALEFVNDAGELLLEGERRLDENQLLKLRLSNDALHPECSVSLDKWLGHPEESI